MTNVKRLQILLKKRQQPMSYDDIKEALELSHNTFEHLMRKAVEGNYIYYIGKGAGNQKFYSLGKSDLPPDNIPKQHPLMEHLFQHVFTGEKHV